LPAIWNFITDFGDSAVTVPLALLMLVFLIAARERRLAFAWVLALGGCAMAIGALKLVFGVCGSEFGVGAIVSPSGHTAMSTSVYGSLALVIGSRLSAVQRYAVFAGAGVAIIAIALSRLALHDHTLAEIVVGLAVGGAAVAAFRWMTRYQTAPALPIAWLLLCGAGIVAVMHGARWMIEPAVHRLAWDLRLILPWCR
jgi:membrane-associated phospholipid phosphatase